MTRLRVALLLALLCVLIPAPLIPAARAAAPSSSTARTTAKTSPNLLANPGFEQGLAGHPWMPAGWDTSSSGLLSVFFGRDTFLVHGGSYAVSIANLSTRWVMAHNWSQGLLVDKSMWGKDAVFSVWTRSNGLQGRAFIRAAIYRDTVSKMAKIWKLPRSQAQDSLGIHTVDDPLLELGWRYQYFVDAETDWVRREVRLYIPPTTNWLRLSFGVLGTGQVIFDDASLTLVPAAPPPPLPLHQNLLADPGFEGDATAWEFSTPPWEGIHVDRDTTLAHSGRACIHMEDEGRGLNLTATGACQAIVNRGMAGKHLHLSAWMKTDSLLGNANIALFFKTPTGIEHPVPALYSQTHDWMQVTLDGDAPPDTYETWVWFMYESPAPGRVYFDDCSLEVTGAAAKPAPAGNPVKKPPAKKAAAGSPGAGKKH